MRQFSVTKLTNVNLCVCLCEKNLRRRTSRLSRFGSIETENKTKISREKMNIINNNESGICRKKDETDFRVFCVFYVRRD